MCISREREIAHMKNGLTELVFVLDRSHSMKGREIDMIEGFNKMLAKQKKVKGEANLTTVFFDDQIEIVHDRFPIEIVEPLTADDYFTRGSTALLDAIGSTVKKIKNIQQRLPEEMKAEKILFFIISDDKENASMEYTYRMIKKMVNQEQGWVFIFFGANMDVKGEAEKLGIKSSNVFFYKDDSHGRIRNFEIADQIATDYRFD